MVGAGIRDPDTGLVCAGVSTCGPGKSTSELPNDPLHPLRQAAVGTALVYKSKELFSGKWGKVVCLRDACWEEGRGLMPCDSYMASDMRALTSIPLWGVLHLHQILATFGRTPTHCSTDVFVAFSSSVCSVDGWARCTSKSWPSAFVVGCWPQTEQGWTVKTSSLCCASLTLRHST